MALVKICCKFLLDDKQHSAGYYKYDWDPKKVRCRDLVCSKKLDPVILLV